MQIKTQLLLNGVISIIKKIVSLLSDYQELDKHFVKNVKHYGLHTLKELVLIFYNEMSVEVIFQ